MDSYKLQNFGMESPLFLSFIFNRLSVRNWSFLAKKKLTGIPLYFNVFEVGKIAFDPPKKQLDLKTRLKLQLEHLICIWMDHNLL